MTPVSESCGIPDIPRYNVLGVGVSELTLPLAVERILGGVREEARGYICVTDVNGISEARRDPAFRRILNRSWLTTPDGMPLVWMGRKQGRNVSRVYGPALMEVLCHATAQSGESHFLYGGRPGVAEELARRLEARHPGLRICGTACPPFRDPTREESDALMNTIARLRPDFFWVGLSTPKQERLMAALSGRLETRLMIGVGAAFDFLSGRIRQAPRWVQRSGLEWIFRITREPRRLGPRYLRNNPMFLLHAAAQLSGLKHYPITMD